MAIDVLSRNYLLIGSKLLYLTMLKNIIWPLVDFTPGVYWYFGLTFQLYVIYLVFYKHRSSRLIWLGMAICVLGEIIIGRIMSSSGTIFHWYKLNCFGWLPVFLIGVYFARKENGSEDNETKQLRPLILLIMGLIGFVGLIVCNMNFYSWILVPFIAVFCMLCFVKGVESVNLFKKIGKWLGKYSACIFVCHPLIRKVLIVLTNRGLDECWAIPMFLVLTGAFACVYSKLYVRLKKMCNIE